MKENNLNNWINPKKGINPTK